MHNGYDLTHEAHLFGAQDMGGAPNRPVYAYFPTAFPGYADQFAAYCAHLGLATRRDTDRHGRPGVVVTDPVDWTNPLDAE